MILLKSDMKNYMGLVSQKKEEVLARARKDRRLKELSSLSREEFERVLLQNRFRSFQFTPLYDEALCFLSDGDAKRAVRNLRNEEYPIRRPSHREDLFTDLAKIGISKERIGMERVSNVTQRSIDDLYGLVRPELGENPSHYDIRCISGLGIAEEALIAEEYDVILRELERRYSFARGNSVFYEPHQSHDEDHAAKLFGVLGKLVRDEGGIRAACGAMDKAYVARIGFYEQFKA